MSQSVPVLCAVFSDTWPVLHSWWWTLEFLWYDSEDLEPHSIISTFAPKVKQQTAACQQHWPIVSLQSKCFSGVISFFWSLESSPNSSSSWVYVLEDFTPQSKAQIKLRGWSYCWGRHRDFIFSPVSASCLQLLVNLDSNMLSLSAYQIDSVSWQLSHWPLFILSWYLSLPTSSPAACCCSKRLFDESRPRLLRNIPPVVHLLFALTMFLRDNSATCGVFSPPLSLWSVIDVYLGEEVVYSDQWSCCRQEVVEDKELSAVTGRSHAEKYDGHREREREAERWTQEEITCERIYPEAALTAWQGNYIIIIIKECEQVITNE